MEPLYQPRRAPRKAQPSAEMLQLRIGFCQGQPVKRDAFENCRTGAADALRVWKISG